MDESTINLKQTKPCPYQGLEPFTKEKHEFFHGRTKDIQKLIENLKKINFILVTGISGVGKSSLVRAGLAYELEETDKRKTLAIITPGTDPISKLKVALEYYFENEKIDLNIFKDWYRSCFETDETTEILPFPAPGKLLLVVDQLEEVITYCDKQQQNKFIKNLLKIANDQVYVIATIRTDFQLLISEISEAKNDGKLDIYILDRLQGSELREAIVRPLGTDYTFGDGLVDIILGDVGKEDCLPQLQFTLKQLWEKAIKEDNNTTILTHHYKSIGGLKGSLNRRVNEIYEKLTIDLEKDLVEQLFISLVQFNKDEKDSKRKRNLTEILDSIDTNKKSEMENVLNLFVKERLLVNDDGWIDLAHESLMEGWSKFKEWRTINREIRRIIDQINDSQEKWIQHEKQDNYLLTGGFLDQVQEELIKNHKNIFSDELKHILSTEYLNASIRHVTQTQVLKAKDLEFRAEETKNKIYSSDPMSGLIDTLLLVNQQLKNQPLKQLPGSIQNALCLAMEISREQNCLIGHNNLVKCVAISHNSKWIVSGGADNILRLWNDQGKCCCVFEGHTAAIWSVAFSPDDLWIVSGGADNTLRRWKIDESKITDSSRKKQIISIEQLGNTFIGHSDWIRAVAVSPDGDFIISGSKDCTLIRWSLDGEIINQSEKKHDDWIFSIAIWKDLANSENSFIVSGSVDKTIQRWNWNLVPMGSPFTGHEGWVRAVAITNDGKKIISGSEDRSICIWNLEGICIKKIEAHESRVLSVAVWQDLKLSGESEKSEIIASGSADHSIKLWNLNGDLIGNPLKGHMDWVRDVKISSNGRYIASASRDKTVRIWNLDQGNLIGKPFGKQSGRILSVTFYSDGEKIVSGGEDRNIYIWNADDGTNMISFGDVKQKNNIKQPSIHSEGHTDWIRSVRTLKIGNNQYIISGCADNQLHIWKEDGTHVMAAGDGHDSWIRSIAISPNGKNIVSSSNDKTLCVWEIELTECSNFKQIRKLNCFVDAHEKEVLSVAFSPDSKHIASGSADRTIKIWDLEGNIKLDIQAHNDRVLSIAYSPDGQYLVSASYDHTIRLWNVENGQEIWQKQVVSKVRSVAFSPIKQYPLIVSGNLNGTLQFWSVEEGCQIGNALEGHQDVIRSVKFSPDGKQVVSVSEDGTLRLRKAGNWQEWLKICCKRISFHPRFLEKNETEPELHEIHDKSLKDQLGI